MTGSSIPTRRIRRGGATTPGRLAGASTAQTCRKSSFSPSSGCAPAASLLLDCARRRFVEELYRLGDRLPVLELVADLYLPAFPEVAPERQSWGNLHHRPIVELNQLTVYVDDFTLNLAFTLLGWLCERRVSHRHLRPGQYQRRHSRPNAGR